jgi:hypothetical protein
VATELGSAYISVGMGTNTLAGDIKKAFGSAESSGASAGKSAGKGFGGAFGIAAAAVGALGIGTFFKSAIGGAAELEQSVGAIGSVFKGSAGQMNEWAQTAATDVGLSANEFNELGTLIGSQLKNGGTAMDELAPKTKSLITTGADLASMFGGTTSEAVAALSSALKGERDPIERYGVSLNQAKIDAEAAALGFAKVGGTLSAEASQAATLSLIMKQTADAHGNFGRETDTLAHKQQVLNAQLANGKARIGTELLPAVAALTGALSSALGPAINGTVAAIRGMVQGFSDFYAGLTLAPGQVAELGAPLEGLVKIGAGIRGVFDPARIALEDFFAGLTMNADTVASIGAPLDGLVGVGARIRQSFSDLWAGFTMPGDMVAKYAGQFSNMESIGIQLRAVFTAIGVASAGVWSAIGPQVTALAPQLFALFQALSPTSLIFQALLPVLPQIAAAIGGVIGAVLPLVLSLTSQLIPIITQLVSAVLPMLITIFASVIGAIAPLIVQIAGLLIPIIQALLPVVVAVFGAVAAIIASAMQIVQGIIQVITGIISGNWSQVWDGIVNTVLGALSLVGNIVIGLKDIVLSALAGAGGWLVDSGKALIQGFIDGISGMVGAIGDAVGGVLGAVADFFPHSPAKKGPFSGRGYTTHSGAALAGDFADSIAGQRNRVAAAAAAVTGAAVLSGSMIPAGASYAGVDAAGSASGAGVNVNIHPAPGMSEETIGRVAANSLNYQLRMAR